MDLWKQGVRESKLIDVSKIDKVPMEYFFHTNDTRCPPKDHALKLAEQIKAPYNLNIFDFGSNLTRLEYPEGPDDPTNFSKVTEFHSWVCGFNYDETWL